jgi:hypothetical protein
MNKIRTITLAAAAGALAAVPAVSDAHHRQGHQQPGTKRCVVKPAFFVKGTITSFSANSVTISVTGANKHARRSGDLADQDPNKAGVQVKGATYAATSSAADTFTLKLTGYESGESPGVGDKVRILGKIELTRKRCAAAGTSLADRYGDVNIKRVRVIDGD